MSQTKLIKDFRANRSEASSQLANSSVTYEQIAKELNDYFEGRITFTFGKDAEKFTLYYSEGDYTISLFWFCLLRTENDVLETLNSVVGQSRLKELYNEVMPKKTDKIASSSTPYGAYRRGDIYEGGVWIKATPTIELFLDVQGISDMMERVKSNKQKAKSESAKNSCCEPSLVYMLSDIAKSESAKSCNEIVSPQVTQEFINSIVKLLNAEYGNKECSFTHFNSSQCSCFILYLMDNRNGSNKRLTIIPLYATEYEALKHINSEYFANRLSVAYKELFGKELNKQPAPSQELLTLRQIAKELDSYFEGLVEVLVDESKLAISLKLDKLGGFQLDDYITWSKDTFKVSIDFYGGFVELSKPLAPSGGLFCLSTNRIKFLNNLKYRAQSLKD